MADPEALDYDHAEALTGAALEYLAEIVAEARRRHRGPRAELERDGWGDDRARAAATELGANVDDALAYWRTTLEEELAEGLPSIAFRAKGRPTDDPRDVRITLRMSQAEALRLDLLRGDESRSDYLRRVSGACVVSDHHGLIGVDR